MSQLNSNPVPKFFWQSILILLPVVVLTIVGLISLKQDERAAEQDARNRAAENVQSLARAMRSSVDDELLKFMLLRNRWTAAVATAGQPGDENHYYNDQLKADVKNWEKDYPGFKLDDLALPDAEILTNGEQIDPPDFPVAPMPPGWFLELSPAQKNLWESLRSAKTPTEIETRRNLFQESKPADEAHWAAYNLFCSPDQRMVDTYLATETGIYFEDIAGYELLSATNVQWSDNLLQLVRDRTIDHPSFMSSKLLKMAERLPQPTNAHLQQNLFFTQQQWSDESKIREWMQSLRQLPGIATNGWNRSQMTLWAHWTDDSKALAFFASTVFSNMASRADGKTVLTGPGYTIYFLPQSIIEAIFARALNENKFLIPGYAHTVVTVEGKPVVAAAKPAPEQSLLGTATQVASLFSTADGARFEVKYYLISRDQMLVSERHRAKLFGALILGSTLVALIGFVTALRAFQRQQQLGEMKSNFVSSVSHELRAPIASVRLMAENLERGKIPETRKQNEYFHFIVQECHRLSSLIENVLDFSRIEQNRKQYNFEPTDLVALTQQTVKLMQPYAAEKNVRLEAAVFPASAELNADGRALQQALVNLIDNAVKHSPDGSTVQAGLEYKEGVFQLWVEDAGKGIPPAEHAKIFERFYRHGPELRRETQGVGIGLSIVKHIVDAHGGKILVRSKPDQGSRFTIELPA